MITKENLQTIYQRYTKKGELNLVRTMEVGIHFLLTTVLAGGEILGGCAPFGVAMVAASGAGLCGGASLLGAILGYLSLHSFATGLRYVSAAILVFALGFCFYDIRWLQRPVVVASAAAVINGVTGFLHHGGGTGMETLYYLGEIAITGLASWGSYSVLLTVRLGRGRLQTKQYRVAEIIFLGCILISLGEVWLIEGVSLGRTVATLFLMLAGWSQGVGVATVLGVLLGFGFNLVFLDFPYHIMMLGFSSLCGGLFHRKSRYYVALGYTLGNGIGVLWAMGTYGSAGILLEVFLGGVIFLCLPPQLLTRVSVGMEKSKVVEEEMTYQTDEIARVREQLEDTAKAFAMLSETLKTAFAPPENENDFAVVFDRAANKVCNKCVQREKCWEKDYVSTFNAMNDASGVMLRRGKGEASDFPAYFSYRCQRFQEFLGAVNEELIRLLYRRQYSHRIRESRVAVCGHYQQLSNILSETATEMGQDLAPKHRKAHKLRHYLLEMGLEAQVTLREDSRGLLQGEVRGEGVEVLLAEEGRSALAHCLGLPLRVSAEGETIRIAQEEPFMAVAGVASSRKDGEVVSGDSNSYFKRKDGTLFVLLCDGMGSGEQAKGESHLAIRLLENFLQAGVDTEQALLILSSALALRGEDAGGFTTVDLLELNLLNAKGRLYKLGAAPSYLKRGEEIRRIGGSSLPVGVAEGDKPPVPMKVELQLQAEDCLLLASDGIVGTGEDGWLCQMLRSFNGKSPKEFVDR
ncbi:MAG: SpoIIE family protein phosphatase, partial [Eubacteriales bacterium]